MDNEDVSLQYAFDESLVNKHFEEVLDIIGEKLKTKKQLHKNKQRILDLLKETFPYVTDEKLANGFNIVYSNIQEIPFKYNTIKDINDSINRYSQFILSIHNQFKDHGFTMLLCGYFWFTRKF